MSDGISIDSSEINRLVADLQEVADVIPDLVKKAVQQTAIKTKKEWQSDARGKAGRRTRKYARTIDYTEQASSGFGIHAFSAEIGPNLSRYGGRGGMQPSLGILEESGVKGGGRGSIRVADRFAEEELLKGVEIAVEQSLRRANL